jgi:hypothetical protein
MQGDLLAEETIKNSLIYQQNKALFPLSHQKYCVFTGNHRIREYNAR